MNKANVTSFVHSHQHVTALCVICLLTVCAFLPTFWNGFQMEWDDQWMVMNPLTTHPLGVSYFIDVFSIPFNGQWGPLNQILYSVIYSCFGYSPIAFHLFSLIIHLFNVCLVYLVAFTILSECETSSLRRAKTMSVITTLFFAIHPLQVESIAWISASKIVLSSFFYLCATYLFVLYIRRRSTWYYLATIILYCCSYMSKENVLTFPLWTSMLCLIYKVPLRSRFFWRTNLPLFVLTLLFGLHLILYVTDYTSLMEIETYNVAQRITLCSYSLIKYVLLWMFPFGLNWMHSFPVPFGNALPSWMSVCPYVILAILTLSWRWVKQPIIASSLLFFLVHLLFVIHLLVLPRNAVIAERYMYLPIIGLNMILACLLSSYMPKECAHKTGGLLLFVLSVLCIIFTFHRTGQWADSKTLRKGDLKEVNTSEPLIIPLNK